MTSNDLDKKIRMLITPRAPKRDLWPEIAREIGHMRRRHVRFGWFCSIRPVAIAAAVCLACAIVTVSLIVPRIRPERELETYKTALENAGLWESSEIKAQYRRLKRAESDYEKAVENMEDILGEMALTYGGDAAIAIEVYFKKIDSAMNDLKTAVLAGDISGEVIPQLIAMYGVHARAVGDTAVFIRNISGAEENK